jgi:hypothetical protein
MSRHCRYRPSRTPQLLPMIQMLSELALPMAREAAVQTTTPRKISTTSCRANLCLPTYTQRSVSSSTRDIVPSKSEACTIRAGCPKATWCAGMS